MLSNSVGWQAIDSQFDAFVESNSSNILAKAGCKIRRRTRILNRELKKFARLKSYSQYVKIKTNILRNVSEDESTEDEVRSVYKSSSEESLCVEFVPEITEPTMSTMTRKTNNEIEGQSNKIVENSHTSAKDQKVKSSSCAKRNLTSLLDKLETASVIADETEAEENVNNNDGNRDIEKPRVPAINVSIEGESTNVPTGDSGIDDDSQDNSPTCHQDNEGFVEIDDIGDCSDQKQLPHMSPARNSTTDDERIDETQVKEEDEGEILQSEAHDDKIQKSQPTIKCTEIVKSKYSIIRDENGEENCPKANSQDHETIPAIEESMDFDGISPETERVAKLKRINLLCSGSDSDSSEDNSNDGNNSVPLLHDTAISSQMISDLSDSDDFSTSSSLHITDSDDVQTPEILDRHEGETSVFNDSRNEQFTRKSIKDQIERQDFFNSSQNFEEETKKSDKEVEKEEAENPVPNEIDEEVENIREKSFKINEKSNGVKYKPSTSLKYVLKNLSKRQLCDEEHVPRADNVDGHDTTGRVTHEEENLSRPFELKDFVTSEKLIPTCELSTITIKDISTTLDGENDDEDVWLMEIPRSIMTDPTLCGKRMVIEKKNMRIGEASYITSARNDISFSCILRSKKKKARYKTVNIRPVCSIKVRHLPVKKESLMVAETQHSPESVPFPKNLKSRNPLMDANDKSETPPLKKNRTNVERDQKGQRKSKNRQKGFWHIDRFVLKPKKKKKDIP